MATLDQIIKITGTLKLGGVPSKDAGKALILSAIPGVFGSSELSRLYSSDSAIETDWVAGTPARIYGDQLFGQPLTPAACRVGKLAVGPALTFVVAVTQVLNTTVYAMRVDGQLATYTSDGTATNDEIVTGLQTAINALSISGLTTSLLGSVGSKTLQLQWSATTFGTVALKDTSGVDYGPFGLNYLSITATTADPGTSIATQLTAIKNATNDFFFVLNPYAGSGITPVIATWCAANGKVLIQADPSSAIATHVLSGATDVAAALNSASDGNAAVIYHGDTAEAADAAWVGFNSPKPPGTETWWGSKLKGVTVENLDDTSIANVLAKKANCFISVGDDVGTVLPITTFGTCADGSFIDAVRFKYALESNAQSAMATVALAAEPGKLEGSDRGIQILYGAMSGAFAKQTGAGADKPLSDYSIQIPTVADIVNRVVSGFDYTADYKGAIQGGAGTGVITEG